MLKSILLGLALGGLSLTGCYISYHHNRTRLFNGFCLVSAFFSFIGSFLINTIHFTWHNLYRWSLGIVLVGLLFCCLLYCLQSNFHKRQLLIWAQKKHIVGLAVLLISVLILGILGLSWLGWSKFLNKINYLFFFSLYLIFTYFLICFLTFLATAYLFSLWQPKFPQKYLIILGAGLLHGQYISPLLAARINRGIKFYQQQKAAGFTPPLIICSGGQGGDEHLAEAQAMGRYLLQKGIDPHHILLEKHSHNTYENMLFSQKIIAQKGIAFTQGLFVTSNYHVYRAGLMAHQVGLNIAGLGSKTHFPFWCRALGREFAAILLRYKYLHLMSIVSLVILTIVIVF